MLMELASLFGSIIARFVIAFAWGFGIASGAWVALRMFGVCV